MLRGLLKRRAFTLVELLVVIVIIGILMGLAVPAIFSAVSTANSTAMKMELNSLETAVQKYQEKYGDYPPDFSDWAVVERHYRKIFPRISSDLVLLKTLLDLIHSVDTESFPLFTDHLAVTVAANYVLRKPPPKNQGAAAFHDRGLQGDVQR